MKKQLLTLLLASGAYAAGAAVVNDSVQLGTGYANQVWYSLKNDSVKAEPKTNWDLGFDVKGLVASIYINPAAKLWAYPKDDTGGWATVDTSGLKYSAFGSAWPSRVNSDTSWQLGAMGRYSDPSNPFDLDWGIYDFSGTHFVIGDSLYIMRTANGSFKKLWIESLKSGVFSFKYANLDGSNETVKTIKKTDYANRNLAYFSLATDAALNREPAADAWDLTFCQYIDVAQFAMGNPSPVTGVLHNNGVMAVKVTNLPNKDTVKNWNTPWTTGKFKTDINVIGFDWKTLVSPAPVVYAIKDSTIYFVRAVDEEIWKITMTGFGGSADGKIVFSKEKLADSTNPPGTMVSTTGKTLATVAVYPNPATSGADVKVVYAFDVANTTAVVRVFDITGKMVYTSALEKEAGMHYHQLPVLNSGNYIVSVETENGRTTQKLVVQ